MKPLAVVGMGGLALASVHIFGISMGWLLWGACWHISGRQGSSHNQCSTIPAGLLYQISDKTVLTIPELICHLSLLRFRALCTTPHSQYLQLIVSVACDGVFNITSRQFGASVNTRIHDLLSILCTKLAALLLIMNTLVIWSMPYALVLHDMICLIFSSLCSTLC